jgi:hypothetical protein
MLCLICWLDGQTKWVLDPAYHQYVTGHAPDTASDEIADALLDGRLVLARAPERPARHIPRPPAAADPPLVRQGRDLAPDRRRPGSLPPP